tara:strand:- start:161 stop:406 length:246 start_codon:yes stop_codon:yes gene_type:complete
MKFGSGWQHEMGPNVLSPPTIKGAVKMLPKRRGKIQEWRVRITNTKTNKILEELIITAKETDSAVARAHELATTWREKDDE